ncbi:MAG: ParB N-terminal domain-containing protein [Dehalococcoidales bacterium]|nr:ParB N-terminal domain-containing protein [Dehalococcoidales bacterium]
MKLQNISIGLLLEHPENSNFMNAETAQKLRRHIEQTGRYEPLTVRPHLNEDGKFQVINGHNRLRVLRALDYQTVNCIVWDLDDDQTRLYLATLNRLSGCDVPERRAALLENLLTNFDIDELTKLLPDDRKQMEELKRLSQIKLEEIIPQAVTEEGFEVPVILDFLIEEFEAKEINLALDLIVNREKRKITRGQALVSLARFYLRRCQEPTGV